MEAILAEGKLKIHSENILPIIKKWLYSDKDIFVRELVSNACDAISKIIYLRDQEGVAVDGDDFRIDLTLNKEAKTLTISDNGVGMTSEEVEKYIAQLAFSGAEEFVEKYKTSEEKDQFIGHFGLGFYSAFMVSKNVEIETLSYQEGAKGARWVCDGSSTYTLEESDQRKSRGTDICLHISDEEYLEASKIRKILKTYCDFLPYPIYLDGELINKDEPIWIKSPKDLKDEDYLNFYHKLYPTEPDPIFWIHLNVDHPFHLKGVLFFPKITPRFDFQSSHIKLYSNRVYVSDNCKDLFPEYLTVLRGAIDSPDIPLNVSRSYLQMDSTVRKLSAHISKKVSDRLGALYLDEKEKFTTYWPDMETIIKLGILHDEKFYEKAKEFLLWKNTKEEWTTVEEYKERHKEAYKDKVFYTAKESQESQFLSLYNEKNIEVLYGGGPLDTAIYNYLEAKLGVHFQRIDGGIDDIIIDKENEKTLLNAEGKSEAAVIGEQFKALLAKEDLEIEAKSLTSSTLPGFVLFDESTRRMRDYLSMTQKEMPASLLGRQTFIINTNNPLITKIVSLEDKALAKAMAEHLYDLSLLSQRELHPESLTPFINRSSEVLHKLVEHLDQKPSPIP